jgi:hypothetical protein
MRAVILGSAIPATITGAAMPTSDGKGWVLEAAIPWTAIGVTPAAGTTLRFDLALIDGDGGHARSRVPWSGGAGQLSDRGSWGRLLLAP